ncbi:PAS domain S-box protein [Natrinema salsiterrestre]|uniref:histidine kinase n=1 Tax=Natrinema salsiterrestre TaxID=2950540 RepID=A0A9Q4Q0X7_9EURY|nr:PAS domain S-box protein [Natrinema salsiterrestre]MDF9747180.1 PAS domain S-box protein [Natrinema salsiterrestre]
MNGQRSTSDSTGRTGSTDDFHTVQLLLADEGRRTTIRDFVGDRYEITAERSVSDADLTIVGDRLFSEYAAKLRHRVGRRQPVFCPIVLLRRDPDTDGISLSDPAAGDDPPLVDAVVEPPLEPARLRRRLHSLLERRRQSLALSEREAETSAGSELRRGDSDDRASPDWLTDTVLEVGPEWRLSLIEDRAERIFDVDADAVRGRSLWDVLPDFVGTGFEDAFRRTMQKREPTSTEGYYSGTDGWLSVRVCPDPGGGVSASVCDVADRTVATRRYETIFNHTYQFTGLLKPDGTLIEANDPALEFGGFDRDDVIGRPIWEAGWFSHSNALQKRVMEDVSRASNGEFARRTVEVQGADGTATIDFSVRPVRDEQGTVTLLVPEGRDITALDERKRELERHKRQFEAVFEDPKMLVGLLEPDGTLIQANETAMSAIDAELEEIAGDPFWDAPWWPPDAAADVREWIDRAADGEYVEYEREHAAQGDDTFTVSGTIRPVTNGGGDVVSLIASAHDVTERKQRERELEVFEILLEEMTDLVTVLDEEGTVQYQTPSIQRVLGYEPSALEDENAFEHVHPDDREAVTAQFADLVDRPGATSDRIELRIRHADGSWRWLESIGTNRSGTPIDGYLINSRDITERKRRERELERTNERLEAFASIVSHDLRNPLNLLAGSLELAEETGDPEQFEHCYYAIDRMEQLVEDLLMLARQGDRVDSIDTVTLRKLVEECWQTVDTGDATVRLDSPGRVLADESRVRQLLENLLRNAVEHGSPSQSGSDGSEDAVERGGEGITVTVGGLDDGFYVEDDGSGISPADRDQVFESGYSTTTDGTGLGLSIVTEIADAHGWQVELVEGDSGGARFEFTDVSDPT